MDTGVEVRAYDCREDTAMVLRACGQKEDIEEMASTSRLYIEVLGHKKDTAGVAGASRLDIEVFGHMADTAGVVGASRLDIEALGHKKDTAGAGVEEPEHAPALEVTPVAVGLAVGCRVTSKDP